MRTAVLACLIAAVGLVPQADPLVPMGVWYGGPGVQAPEVPREAWKDAETWRRDLAAIRAAGFNGIATWTTWREIEPIRGRYRLDPLEQVLRLAGEAGLRTALHVFPEPAPEWHAGPPCDPRSTLGAAVAAAQTRAEPHGAYGDPLTAAPGPDGCPSLSSLIPKPAGRPPMTPAELAFALDRLRGAPAPRGWRLARLQGARDVVGEARGAEVTDADLRLWTWAALSRGARGVWFDSWPRMIDGTGAPSRAALAAGALAANLARNARLFASVAPRPAPLAVLHTGDDAPALALHRAAFDRNLAADVILPGDLLSGVASRYQALLVQEPQPPVLRQALKVFEQTGGRVLTDPAALDGLLPDIRIDGAPGFVEARFLESPDAWVIVALNHAETPQKATLAFGPEIPEAIWVDMETGNSVNFVQTKTGPTLTQTFPARDVLVLVRSKRLR